MKYHIPVADRFVTIKYDESLLTRSFAKNYEACNTERKKLCTVVIHTGKSDSSCRIFFEKENCVILQTGTRKNMTSFKVINFFIKVAIQFFALQENILLLHASSIIYKGQGFVFAGLSGTGKSTILHLARCSILSDDTTVIKKEKDGFIIYPSPFDWAKESIVAKRNVHLKKLYFLQKSSITKIKRITPEQAAKRLLFCNFLQEYLLLLLKDYQPSPRITSSKRLTALIYDLVNHTNVGVLMFEKNNKFLLYL